MQLDENRFDKLEKDVTDIRAFLLGDEYRTNGIKHRIERLEGKDKARERRWWVTLGGIAVLMFLMKWGDKILENLL